MAPPSEPSSRGSPSRTEASSDTSSSHSAESSDRRDVEILTQGLPSKNERSEEYRLMFRLPSDEVLVQDFNCALQENILLQGHMYLFTHHICFYSNIFGFETKRIIPFDEVTCVRKAKTAAIFPNAIEISGGLKKYFFGSFLSRDEAYRLITEGWSQHSNASLFLNHQELNMSNQVNGLSMLENAGGLTQPTCDSLTLYRNAGDVFEERKPSSNGKIEAIALEGGSEIKENGEENIQQLSFEDLKIEDVDAPKVPDYFTLLAEAKFPVCIKEFLNLFISNQAGVFLENFRARCGDKDFQYTPWHLNEQFGCTRDLSFLHPVKVYLGAKFGRCQEVQKLRVYRNSRAYELTLSWTLYTSHLIIETSQQISDVPYADYFKVEGLWDVEESGEQEIGCILRVYCNVAFSKKTMFRGKIEQSTKDECREVYGFWIENANNLLKQKSIANLEGVTGLTMDMISSDIAVNSSQSHRDLHTTTPTMIPRSFPDGEDTNQQSDNSVRGDCALPLSIFRESMASICAKFRSPNYLQYILVASFVAILILIQVSIIILLNRNPEIQLVTPGNYMSCPGSYSSESLEWLEKRFNYLKEEMLTLESRMERMRHEYASLKLYLESLERFKHKS